MRDRELTMPEVWGLLVACAAVIGAVAGWVAHEVVR